MPCRENRKRRHRPGWSRVVQLIITDFFWVMRAPHLLRPKVSPSYLSVALKNCIQTNPHELNKARKLRPERHVWKVGFQPFCRTISIVTHRPWRFAWSWNAQKVWNLRCWQVLQHLCATRPRQEHIQGNSTGFSSTTSCNHCYLHWQFANRILLRTQQSVTMDSGRFRGSKVACKPVTWTNDDGLQTAFAKPRCLHGWQTLCQTPNSWFGSPWGQPDSQVPGINW